MKIANILLEFDNENNQEYIEKSFINYALYLTIRNCSVLSIYKKNIVKSYQNINISNKFLKSLFIKFLELFSLISSWINLIKFEADIAICYSSKSIFFIKSACFFSAKKFPIILICDTLPNKKIEIDYVITHYSNFVKDLVSFGINRDRIFVISHVIDFDRNFIPPVKKNFKKPLKIGSIGKIEAGLNFDKVLKAIKILQSKNIDCEYIIAGFGDDEDRLNLLAIEMHIDNKFKIIPHPENKLDFYNEIDICVMPLSKYNYSEILLEPMLFNTPIIASKTYYCDEVIEDNLHGIKVAIEYDKDIAQLIAENIENMLTHESEAVQMAKRAYYKILDKHSVELISNKIYNICKDIQSKNL